MQSSRVRLMLVALLGVFAFSAVAAAAAQAEEAPFWSIGGTRLEEGKTHYITAKVYNVAPAKGFTLKATTGQTVICPFIRLKEGVLLGSKAGNAGTNDEVIEFFGETGNLCTVENNGAGCTKIKEPVVTNPVKSELVESEKSTTAALLVEFFTEKVGEIAPPFAKLVFEQAACTLKETTVSGKVAGEVREDPNNGTLGGVVKLPNTKIEAKSWLLNFPTTPINTFG